MQPSTIHLPDGQNFTITSVFGGLFFKSHELNVHPSPFPIGWTVVLNTSVDDPDDSNGSSSGNSNHADSSTATSHSSTSSQPRYIHFRTPTLQRDSLYISSISTPSSADFKPAASPTRQIAMMLWVTLYWYFHQPEPDTTLPATDASRNTWHEGRPQGQWRINIRHEGVLRGRNLIPKLERMGLITAADSSVGVDDDAVADGGASWRRVFVLRRAFWQLPGRLFLFTLQPTHERSGPPSVASSRPTSPQPGMPAATATITQPLPTSSATSVALHATKVAQRLEGSDVPGGLIPLSPLTTPLSVPIGPFYSSSHLPTYYPPPPLLYTVTRGVRHPIRPKPPRMGEVFYTRFVPSVGQYLSFRVASSSPRAVPYLGPCGPNPPGSNPADATAAAATGKLVQMSDAMLLESWFASARVQKFWGAHDPTMLQTMLSSPHSFPVIGLWDGVPFGYFEIYWVREDILGRHLSGADAMGGDFDRGIHVFIGEDWARGRVQPWLTSLVHWCLTTDYRTMSVCLEPRVDNTRFIQHLEYAGFVRERQVAFPHKQSWLLRLRRDNWEAPAL